MHCTRDVNIINISGISVGIHYVIFGSNIVIIKYEMQYICNYNIFNVFKINNKHVVLSLLYRKNLICGFGP